VVVSGQTTNRPQHPADEEMTDAQLDADTFLALFDLTTAETARLLQFRRLAALFWLTLLRPGSRARRRHPPGTLKHQADRLLALLGC
jgi:hypothetical protein